jgi:hypothetical protein
MFLLRALLPFLYLSSLYEGRHKFYQCCHEHSLTNSGSKSFFLGVELLFFSSAQVTTIQELHFLL